MKILQIINSLSVGGAEKLLVDLVEVLNDDTNLHVDVLLLSDKNDSELLRRMEQTGAKVYILNSKNIYNPLLVFKIKGFMNRYDIIHAHLFPAQYWLAISKMINKSKAKIITTEHNTNNRRRSKFYLKILERCIYSQYENIICISDKAYDNLKKHLGRKYNNICTIYNGVDISKYNKALPIDRSLIGLKNEDYILIMVASFREQKDQETLIKSLIFLPDKVKLVLVGIGNRLADCKKIVSSLNLNSRVKFLGVRHDVPSLLNTADAIVMSSHYEGLSLSSIEGMSVGKPFIASDVPGLNEIVLNAGVLFQEGNHEELGEVVNRLMSDKSYSNKVSKLCYQRSISYDINNMVKKYKKLYLK